MKLQKYFGSVSYNGKYFFGSQTQNTIQNLTTVQSTLVQILEKSFPKNLTNLGLRLASRTDKGVHAYNNVFDFLLQTNQEVLIYLIYNIVEYLSTKNSSYCI